MFISSWSGGKDSALACARAMERGYDVAAIANFISDDYRRVRFHGTEAGLIAEQADLAGLRLFQRETSATGYEEDFKGAMRERVAEGYRGMVFGDIYLEEHRRWVERVCAEVGLEALEPLWGEPTLDLLMEFIERGFTAVLVSGMKEHIGREWIGGKLDRDFIEYMKGRPGADPCGERGEYHTFVTGGPIFGGRIEITEREVIERNGFWLLDIKGYKVERPPLAAQ
ncbi:MAG: diphthine--ammonia ligase [Nitrospirota bacterium]